MKLVTFSVGLLVIVSLAVQVTSDARATTVCDAAVDAGPAGFGNTDLLLDLGSASGVFRTVGPSFSGFVTIYDAADDCDSIRSCAPGVGNAFTFMTCSLDGISHPVAAVSDPAGLPYAWFVSPV